jgi:hypothetical protein
MIKCGAGDSIHAICENDLAFVNGGLSWDTIYGGSIAGAGGLLGGALTVGLVTAAFPVAVGAALVGSLVCSGIAIYSACQ